MKRAKLWLYNTLVAFDELANCALLGGAPSDTISGRAERGREDHKPGWTFLANLLDHVQKNHSANALRNDEAGRHTEALDLE
jgi:hypothetical protein